jgi:hypothetical protein
MRGASAAEEGEDNTEVEAPTTNATAAPEV